MTSLNWQQHKHTCLINVLPQLAEVPATTFPFFILHVSIMASEDCMQAYSGNLPALDVPKFLLFGLGIQFQQLWECAVRNVYINSE